MLPAELAERLDFGPARIAAFNGRNDPDHYIWGEIAEQLGQADLVRPYWIDGPRGVDEKKWMEIIGDEPTLILLDELPPYLLNADTRSVGKGSLADLVTYTISNLLTAAIKLPRCCVVIANLSGSYEAQTKDLARIMSNLQQESRRQAQTITPVQLAGNEIYEILKKRLFTELPGDTLIDSVAEAFAEQVKAAEDGGYITARAMEEVAEEVRETYPFHPSFKNLVALFKENEGFRQTRGLMQFTARLLRSVWNRDANDVFLIGTQHLDLNDAEVRDEIQRVNSALLPAVVNDIADHGNARAEEIDGDLGSDAATQVAKLLLSASLSRAVGAHTGLTQAEIIEYLAAPYRKADEFLAGTRPPARPRLVPASRGRGLLLQGDREPRAAHRARRQADPATQAGAGPDQPPHRAVPGPEQDPRRPIRKSRSCRAWTTCGCPAPGSCWWCSRTGAPRRRRSATSSSSSRRRTTS